MLSGEEILKQIEAGNIVIEPFDREKLNPNSYNLTVGDEVMVYVEAVLDFKKPSKPRIIPIPDDGLILMPNNLYLAGTLEYTETNNFIPQISGRSSIGRIGLAVHMGASLGENGYKGKWTFSISVSMPVKIHKGMTLGQIYYFPVVGSDEIKYNKKDTGIRQTWSGSKSAMAYFNFDEDIEEKDIWN